MQSLAALCLRVSRQSSPPPGGITAEYFQGKDLTDHRSTRTDAALDGTGTPPSAIDVSRGFSVRWSGHYSTNINSRTFMVANSNGTSAVRISVFVDGGLVAYDDTTGATFIPTHTFRLDPTVPHDLVVTASYDSYDGSGLAEVSDPNGDLGASNVSPAVVTQTPNEFTLAATGSGKIALYAQRPTGASGVNLYRGGATGAEDLVNPVNGASPVIAPSYSGSPLVLYTDGPGLTDGTDYFYEAKATYDNPVTGTTTLSNPSAEDDDAPDPAGIPWDTKSPSTIIAALQNLAPDDPFQNRVRAMGPDGAVYDSQAGQQLPPEYVYDATTGLYENPSDADDVLTPTQPPATPDGSDASALSPAAGHDLLAFDPSSLDEMLGGAYQTRPVFISNTGPTRKFLAQTGAFMGVRGHIQLPPAGSVLLNDYTYTTGNTSGQHTRDSAYVYFGGSFERQPDRTGMPIATIGGAELDSGVSRQYGKTNWGPFLGYPGSTTPEEAQKAGVPFSPTHYLGSGFPGTSAPYANGSQFLMRFGFFGKTQHDKLTGFDYNARLDITQSPRDVTLVGLFHTHARISTLEIKRLTTIAQNGVRRGVDNDQGYHVTGSHYEGMAIDNLRLLGADLTATGTLWSRTLNARLVGASWPLATPGRVSASTIQQWSNETNLSVNLR